MPSTILSDNGAFSGTAGLKSTASNDGVLAFQTTTGGGVATTAVSISTSQIVTITNDALVNGLTVGKGAGAVSTNTAVGASALQASNSGNGNNTAIGYEAGRSNTTGAYNTWVGGLEYNNGLAVGRNNTTGNYNAALGAGALANNTTASNNTAVGYQAGYSVTTNPQNVFIGTQAGYQATGGYNTALGYSALYSASGSAAQYNTAIGNNSFGAISSGGFNTGVGYNTGAAATTGTYNTFVGAYCGSAITTGGKNTIIGNYGGNQGGLDIRTSSNNIVLSDGDGNPEYARYVAGNISTTQTAIAPNNTATGGLHFVSGYNTANGSQGWWLLATRVNSVTTIASSNNTGLTVTFSQIASVQLAMQTTAGTINVVTTTIS